MTKKDIAHELIERFEWRFYGLDRAYGLYSLDNSTVQASGKHQGSARTVVDPLTTILYSRHLHGEIGLGIIPIDDDSNVRWGCIDIDMYKGFEVSELARALKNKPYIVCRSKSGGAHVFLFTSESVPAQLMQEKLRTTAELIGFPTAEIFPKQQRLESMDDVGSWLNLPYFNASQTQRFALNERGQPLDLREFLNVADNKQLTKAKLQEFDITFDNTATKNVGEGQDLEDFPAGPPCLQTLIKLGIPEGMRNNALYNIGVYLKNRWPESEDVLAKHLSYFNRNFLEKPLNDKEVLVILRSLKRKGYNYKCKDMPIAPHCDRKLCLTRRYGVANIDLDDMPSLHSLCKLNMEQPMWFLNVDQNRVGPLETDELLAQGKFRRKVFEKTNVLIPKIKGDQWEALIGVLSQEVDIVEMPEEASRAGEVLQLVLSYVTSAYVSDDPDDIELKAVFDHDVNEIMFMTSNFRSYIKRYFYDISTRMLCQYLRQLGLEYSRKRFGASKQLSVWVLDVEKLELQKEVAGVKPPESHPV